MSRKINVRSPFYLFVKPTPGQTTTTTTEATTTTSTTTDAATTTQAATTSTSTQAATTSTSTQAATTTTTQAATTSTSTEATTTTSTTSTTTAAPSCTSYTLVVDSGETTANWSYVSCEGTSMTWSGVSGDQEIVCAQSIPTKTSGYGSIFTGAACSSSGTTTTAASTTTTSTTTQAATTTSTTAAPSCTEWEISNEADSPSGFDGDYSYTNCSGTVQTGYLAFGQTVYVCAQSVTSTHPDITYYDTGTSC